MSYTLDTRVRYSQIGPDGFLTVPALVNLLQDSCAEQFEVTGRGLNWLNSMHIGWYITNWEIKIHTMPFMHERIFVRTWPYKFRGVFGYRNFCIESEFGERLAEVDSLWVLMNLRQQKPFRIPQEILESAQVSPRLDTEFTDSRNIELPEEMEEVRRLKVLPTHIDTNRHMNNARYIELSHSALPGSVKVLRIRTKYRSPAMFGDGVVVNIGRNAAAYIVTLENPKGGIYAITEFTCKEIK